jgi:hypothetical protein
VRLFDPPIDAFVPTAPAYVGIALLGEMADS